ncbi:MAG TPA: agmatine deiminase family protein, partial [Opitutaceae bacterium]|nr:agmatine deiminase family protein [Opitutaceae bacterium]
MPAEWEQQSAVWLSWPHNRESWPGCFRPIPGMFAGIVAKISRFENVRVNIAEPLQKRAWGLVAKAGADLSRVTFYDHPTNDAWCRDHGPIFVKNDKTGEVALTDWRYNAWGGKYPPFDLDNQIPPSIGKVLGLRRFENDMILEGGSIDVNGEGWLLTTEACLLNKNRNPDLSKKEIEQNLRDFLGVHTILWLGDGIIGDDTDGHIDDLSRFFRSDGIVTVIERNKRDKNYPILQENLERLYSLRTPGGEKFKIVELPMPKPCFCKGQQMPASYANFLIINGAVLMPAFRQPRRDREAAEVLADCFPGREIISIDCLEMVWGLGTLHCLSQQQPA